MRAASEICKCEDVESGLRQTEPLKLQRPFGRRIPQGGDADAARKPPFDIKSGGTGFNISLNEVALLGKVLSGRVDELRGQLSRLGGVVARRRGWAIKSSRRLAASCIADIVRVTSGPTALPRSTLIAA
jgi:hypothetical protein